MPAETMPAPGPVLQHAREIRAYEVPDLSWREPGDQYGGDKTTILGHAAVFNALSLELWDWEFGRFREQIQPGAFRSVLARDPKVHLVYQHDMAAAMAYTRASGDVGTLELREDAKGLRIFASLDPADPDVQRVRAKVKAGVVREMSFAFTVERDEWTIEGEGDQRTVTRTITEVRDLFDVSVVAQGAYPQTDVGMRELRTRAEEILRRDGHDPSGAETVGASEDSSGGDDVRRRAALRARARLALSTLPKEHH